MTDVEIREKVKVNLNIEDTDNDASLMIKVIAVKQYMINSGASQSQIETDYGVAILTIGVNDIWSMEGGSLKFSDIFNNMLVQMAIKSYEESVSSEG
jgi:hypothetical protein